MLGAMRAVPAAVARHALFLLKSHPALADSLGYHVRPIHYYEPLPDFRDLDAAATRRRRISPAIDFDLPGQRRLLQQLAAAYRGDLEAIAARRQFDFGNDYFGGLDASLYYALIRHLRPAHVVEIGSGMSTRIADLALQANRRAGHPAALTCIEPYPQPRLTVAMPEITLIESRVEDVPLEFFDQLAANDILFIDSSHAVRFGGDVCREYLDILPRLKPGVWVHVHDVFFPQDYPAAWLIDKRLAFNEQYLLEAFLAFNRSFAVRAAAFWLAADHAADVQPLVPAPWPAAGDHGRGSFWMQRVA